MADNPTNDDITYFAKANFRNREQVFGIRRDDRRRHMYIIGKTGVGKTTMLENLAIHDIKGDEGLAYFDPHGESVEKLLDYIPNGRVNQVVYVNPHDTDYPIGFNVLEINDPSQKHLVASGLMAVFTKLWANVWSARMEYILNNTVLALLDTPGNTLLGIPRMYTDKKFRTKIVANIKDPVVRNFWEAEYANYSEKYRTEAIAPIQNKVGQFLSSSIIRNIVSQTKSTIDFREIMDSGNILLVNLSKGRIGEDSSALLGAMMITKIQLAAMSRVDVSEEDRRDFYLYVDEFQNFATESFATILSEARKYKLNLIVAHQYIAQLIDAKSRSTAVRDAIFGNVGTLAVFRVGAEDAEFLEREFAPIFDEIDLVNLSKYNIYLKLMINGVASTPFSAATLPPIAEPTDNMDKVIKVARERYSVKREIIERKIAKWLSVEYFAEAGKTAALDEDEEVDPIFKHDMEQPKTAPASNIEQRPKTEAIKPQAKPVQKALPPKPTQPAPAQVVAPRERSKSGEEIWDNITTAQEKKDRPVTDDLLKKLLGVIEQSDVKPQSLQDMRPEPSPEKNMPSHPEGEQKTAAAPTPKTELAQNREENNDRKLKAGERVKFE